MKPLLLSLRILMLLVSGGGPPRFDFEATTSVPPQCFTFLSTFCISSRLTLSLHFTLSGFSMISFKFLVSLACSLSSRGYRVILQRHPLLLRALSDSWCSCQVIMSSNSDRGPRRNSNSGFQPRADGAQSGILSILRLPFHSKNGTPTNLF